MRPIYETDANRAAQERIGGAVARHWGLRYKDHGRLARIDGAMVDEHDEPVVFVEVKERPGLRFGFGGGYFLSQTKITAAARLAEAQGKGSYLAVEFADGSVWIAPLFRFTPDLLIKHGRRDRNDPADIELCVVYPWSVFERVQ